MQTKTATCTCGQLRLEITGEPLATSVCHCLDCQKRTGSAFGAQARYQSDQIVIDGETKDFTRSGDSGATVTFHFCPNCGSTVFWNPEKLPDQTAVAIGAFADPKFTSELSYAVYEERRHPWVGPLQAQEHY